MAKEEGLAGKTALAAAIATEVAARAAGFLDARVLGGKHRTWQQLRSTKRLKDVSDTLARVSQRPPPPANDGVAIEPGIIIKDDGGSAGGAARSRPGVRP